MINLFIIQSSKVQDGQIVQMMPGIPTQNSRIKEGELLMKDWEDY